VFPFFFGNFPLVPYKDSIMFPQLTCLFIYLFIYLALPTRAGSPQQHMPITVGPFCLTHPVNFPCGRKPEYPEETHDFRQSVDFYSSHEDWVRVALRKFSLRLEPAASEVKGKCANHLATLQGFRKFKKCIENIKWD
jgi:hypothetical protein